MTLTSVTPADGEAILPLALLKKRIRVKATDEDTDIERMRAQAIDFVERHSGVALQRRAFVQTDKQFCRSMRLLVGPVASVEGVTYRDTDGTDTALDDAAWFLGGGYLSAAAGTSWPYASGQEGAVSIEFTAGLEDAEAQAPSLIAAVELMVGHLFANREGVNVGNIVTPMPFGISALCDQYRTPGI